MAQQIRFYKVPDPFGYFCNYSRHPFQLDGKQWPTTEHYYQAQKFVTTDPDYVEAIRIASKPSISRAMGNDRDHPIREGWDDIKYEVMLLALIAKFKQHEDCLAVLRASKDAYLIEDTRQGKDDDHIWGDGSTGKGQNLLGKALMELREALGKDNAVMLEKKVRRKIAGREG